MINEYHQRPCEPLNCINFHHGNLPWAESLVASRYLTYLIHRECLTIVDMSKMPFCAPKHFDRTVTFLSNCATAVARLKPPNILTLLHLRSGFDTFVNERTLPYAMQLVRHALRNVLINLLRSATIY